MTPSAFDPEGCEVNTETTPALHVVERAFSLYLAGDFEALFRLAAEDIELAPVYEDARVRGTAELRQFFMAAGDPRERWRLEAVEIKAVGDDALVTATRITRSAFGGPVDLPVAWLLTVRDGKITSMRGYTGRHQALAARGIELEHARAIFDSLGEGLYAVNCRGEVTFVNRAAERMLDYRQHELLGRNMHDVIHFQRADGTRVAERDCELLDVMRTGIVVRRHDDVFTRRDGTLVPVAYTSAPLVVDGEICGAVLAFTQVGEWHGARSEPD
jgi:PAS domain S-box-containing protein